MLDLVDAMLLCRHAAIDGLLAPLGSGQASQSAPPQVQVPWLPEATAQRQLLQVRFAGLRHAQPHLRLGCSFTLPLDAFRSYAVVLLTWSAPAGVFIAAGAGCSALSPGAELRLPSDSLSTAAAGLSCSSASKGAGCSQPSGCFRRCRRRDLGQGVGRVFRPEDRGGARTRGGGLAHLGCHHAGGAQTTVHQFTIKCIGILGKMYMEGREDGCNGRDTCP
jgi:hypothetical protein